MMPISRHARNILHSPTRSASMTVWSTPPTASRARVALIGNVSFLDANFAVELGIKECYLGHHPDARWWLPNDPDGAHEVSQTPEGHQAHYSIHLIPIPVALPRHIGPDLIPMLVLTTSRSANQICSLPYENNRAYSS